MNKKSIFRKGIALHLAAVTCLSVFSAGATTAFAASNTGECYMVAFPRSGDANLDYSGTWGMKDVSYMNGWHSYPSNYTTVHCMDSYSGQVAYCIEPGVELNVGDTMTIFGEDFWNNYPDMYNKTIPAATIKQLLGRVLTYGFQGNASTSWRSQNDEDADKLAHYMATQVLVWETVVGERDAQFNHVSTGSADPVKSVFRSSHPLYSRFLAWYDKMESQI